MRRLLLVLLALSAAACTRPIDGAAPTASTTAPSTTTTVDPSPTTAPGPSTSGDPGSTTTTPPATAPEPPTPGGPVLEPGDRLAVMTPDGLALAGVDGLLPVEDSPGGVFPAFAPDGSTLVWTRPADGSILTLDLDDPAAVPTTRSAPFPPFYLTVEPDGETIAALGPRGGDVVLSRGPLLGEEPFTFSLVFGTPLFPTASVEGEVAANLGGTVLRIAEDRPGQQGRATAGGAPTFLADGRLAYLDENLHVVVSEPATLEGGEAGAVAAVLAAPGGLYADPASPRLAVAVLESPGGGGALPVQDPAGATLGTGVHLVEPDDPAGSVTLRDQPSFGVFWAPTGDRLLSIEPSSVPGALRWVVLELDGTVAAEIGPVEPSVVFATAYLPFLDQFAQAVDLWAPDGRRFVTSGVDGGGPVVFVHDLDGSTLRLSSGDLAVWAAD